MSDKLTTEQAKEIVLEAFSNRKELDYSYFCKNRDTFALALSLIINEFGYRSKKTAELIDYMIEQKSR
jgi:hypothetical protein